MLQGASPCPGVGWILCGKGSRGKTTCLIKSWTTWSDEVGRALGRHKDSILPLFGEQEAGAVVLTPVFSK